jgi:hypothetical protein
MNEEQLARFEANIERLVESAFANFFGKKVRAQDIALQLARSLEDGVRRGNDQRSIAPDLYTIRLHPQIHSYLTHSQPGLQQKLCQHIVILASQVGYTLLNTPIIELVSDPQLENNMLVVTAGHTDRPENSTVGMRPVAMPAPDLEKPLSAFLLINATRSVRLEQDILNIGRYRDNDIILDDPYVSRHHLQLRRRFGVYMLFDVHSQGGTFVNGVRVKEHQLRSGDVIQIGKSQLVYMEDSPQDDFPLAQTDALDPTG